MTPDSLLALLVVVDDNADPGALARTPWHRISAVGQHAHALYGSGVRDCKVFVRTPQSAKDLVATEGLNPDGLMVRAVREIRAAAPDMSIAPEVCACAYSSAGECVVVDEGGKRDDTATWEFVARMACLHAEAGADRVVAGLTHKASIRAMRDALDDAGHQDCGIIASIQFNSRLYAPYREMMGTEPRGGETHRAQIPPGDIGRAVELLHMFKDEGAEYFVLQPILSNVETLVRLRQETTRPIYAFSVSAELPLHCDAHYELREGTQEILLEYYNSLLHAGADKVQSYVTLPFVRWLDGRKRT